MAEENIIKINAQKSATSRINLSSATIPATPGGAIRVGTNPKVSTSRIDISAIPGASPASSGLGSMPQMDDDDIYKRRTTLLDTSSIPLSAAPAARPASAPGTIRIGGRPTVRLNTSSSAAPATFSPGQPEAAAPPVSASAGGRPTIKLKRPGGGSTISVGGSSDSSSSFTPNFDEPLFVVETDDSPGGAWAIIGLLATFVTIGLIVVQLMTNSGAAY